MQTRQVQTDRTSGAREKQATVSGQSETMPAREPSAADFKSCAGEVGYFLVALVFGYLVVRDGVTAGMLNAWKKQEQQKLKAAEKAERAAQAAAAAKRV